MSEEPTLAERQAASMADLLSILELQPLGVATISISGVGGEDTEVMGTDSADIFEGSTLR